MRGQLEPYYSEIGRPSVDPELMIRMLIVGYCFGLRRHVPRDLQEDARDVARRLMGTKRFPQVTG
jgi:transposase